MNKIIPDIVGAIDQDAANDKDGAIDQDAAIDQDGAMDQDVPTPGQADDNFDKG